MTAKLIRKHSPNLAGVVERLFDAKDLETIEVAFIKAIEQGGLEELDFTRESGVSYNPRPARIALILLNDAHIRDVEVITDAISGTCSTPLATIATWLDRARHWHMASPKPSTTDKELFIEETNRVIKLAETHSTKLAVLLKAWKSRQK